MVSIQIGHRLNTTVFLGARAGRRQTVIPVMRHAQNIRRRTCVSL